MQESTQYDDFQGPPAVSIVLPIRNEAKSIASCVASLLNQDYPDELVEILVVDGMSDDGTREILAAIIEEVGSSRSVRIFDNPKGIVSSALNIGIHLASADIIIRMDGHTNASKTYVSSCVKALLETGAANVGGVFRYTGTTLFGKAVALAQSHVLGAGDAKFHNSTTSEFVDTVPMGAFYKRVFTRVGLFDESMVRNQDYEMNVRIRKAGERIYLDPTITLAYTTRDTPLKLWRQYFQYGWWKVETLRRHPQSLRWRQLLPAVFVTMFIALSMFTFVNPILMLLMAQILLYLSTILIAAGQLARMHRTMESPVPMLFVSALVIIHFAWGCGFLLNLVSYGRFPYRASDPLVPMLV